MWLVAVYSGGAGVTCESSLASFDAAAQSAQSVVRFGTLDASSASEPEIKALSAMGVDAGALKASPCDLQVVLLPDGRGKAELDEYKRWHGGLDDPKSLQQWVLEEVPDSTQIMTSEMELRMFMDAPVTPDDRPFGKVVLFASKGEVPGVYKALALNSRRAGLVFGFGWIPGGSAGSFLDQAKKMLRVSKVPSLVAVVPFSGATAPKDAPPGSVPMSIQPYVGPLKYQMMAAWVRNMGMLTGLSDQAPPARAAGGAAPLADVTSQQQLQEQCYDKGALCLLGLLDGGSPDLGEHVTELEEAAAGGGVVQPGVVSFVRLDASRQRSLRASLGLRRDQLPALAVVSARRLRYALAPPGATFGARAAKELLEGVLAGRVATVPLQDLPRFVDGGEPDDEGAAPAPEEAEVVEEFDLSEIMAEEVAVETKEEQLRKAEEELKAEAEARAKEEAEKKARKAQGGGKKKGKKKKKKAAPSSKHEEL